MVFACLRFRWVDPSRPEWRCIRMLACARINFFCASWTFFHSSSNFTQIGNQLFYKRSYKLSIISNLKKLGCYCSRRWFHVQLERKILDRIQFACHMHPLCSFLSSLFQRENETCVMLSRLVQRDIHISKDIKRRKKKLLLLSTTSPPQFPTVCTACPREIVLLRKATFLVDVWRTGFLSLNEFE